MGLVAVVLLAAVATGWAAGGSLARLARVPLPAAGLVPAAVAAQALGVVAGLAGLPPGPAYAGGLTVSAGLVAVFLARSRRTPGLGLVALGLGLNALVVGANGAMPVSAAAAARAGAEGGALAADLRHVVLDGGTRLPLLADVVPVPLPLRPEVVSPGDVLVAAGLARFLVVGMRSPRSGRPTARVAGSPDRPTRTTPTRTTETTREGPWPSARASAGAARRARRTTASVPTPEPAGSGRGRARGS